MAGYNSETAYAQGWGLFANTEYGLEIERIDATAVFPSDKAALAFVKRQAAKGDGCAKDALRRVAAARKAESKRSRNKAYPHLYAKAAEHLGSLYNVEDYPVVNESPLAGTRCIDGGKLIYV